MNLSIPFANHFTLETEVPKWAPIKSANNQVVSKVNWQTALDLTVF